MLQHNLTLTYGCRIYNIIRLTATYNLFLFHCIWTTIIRFGAVSRAKQIEMSFRFVDIRISSKSKDIYFASGTSTQTIYKIIRGRVVWGLNCDNRGGCLFIYIYIKQHFVDKIAKTRKRIVAYLLYNYTI